MHPRRTAALLDGLAESGFARLGAQLRAAAESAGEDYEARLRTTSLAYVRFAISDAALLELMFAGKQREQTGALHQAADRAFSVILELLASPERLRSMSAAARRLARPDAAERIAERVLELARG